jgi:antitoxin component YwqK of YwqJK toxin-antitoxin module
LFYTTGALQAEGKYVDEKRDSIWKFYNDMQRMIRKDQYKNGKMEGKSVAFYPSGNVLEIKNWKDDSANGPFQHYYEQGGLMEEGTYVHGELQDTLTIYDMGGKVAVRGTYLNDMHEGNWIHYSDGTPTDTLRYHLGRCLNCPGRDQKQDDSLRIHYEHLQQELEHPSNDLENGYREPDSEDH